MTVPAKGSKRRVAFVLFFVVWFLKLISGLIAATDRNAPSYPDAIIVSFPYHMSNVEFCVVMTLVFLVPNLLMAVFASKLPKWLAIIVAVLQVFLLLALLFLGTGGI